MTANFSPGTAFQPTAEIELTLSCRDIIRSDLISKSDPQIVTFIQPFAEKRWVEFHRTVCVKNCHNPDFVSKVKISYRFEEQQHLKFQVYDIDGPSTRLEDHDFVGEAQCTLGQIVASGTSKITLKRTAGDTTQRGYLLVVAEEVSSVKDDLVLEFSGVKLKKKGWFGRSDPFLAFYKSTESGTYSLVHKTEVVPWNTNPKWQRVRIPISTFCSGDLDRNIKVVCWHSSMGSPRNVIGEFYITVNELSKGPSESHIYPLVHPEKNKKPNRGHVRLEYVEIVKTYSFIDYVKGGYQLHCTVAIDFTGSNGDPLTRQSLHYISNSPNLYEQAIISVGAIIQDYDSDKQFPVLGFGARLPPDGRVSHEFFVNLRPDTPYCHGINGVLDAYRLCIRTVQLYGPTNFAPVINHVVNFAKSYIEDNYFILLILTDGIITDETQTIKAIVDASTLPMSIIIVGVGNADFTAMEKLDADNVPLQSGGKRMARDIVQFVPFNKFLGGAANSEVARVYLAREVLAEIPKQFLGFMKANRVVPKTRHSNSPVFLPPDPEIILSAS